MKKVAIQGILGSYHDKAARSYFGSEEICILPCLSFKAVFQEMEKDPSVFGCVAIENTIAGSLLPNYQLLRLNKSHIIGEFKLRISHTLAALPGENLSEIKEINSHPIALMQCDDFLQTLPHVKIVEKEDTASCARNIAIHQMQNVAAICSKEAALEYGLSILAESIETNPHNFTRFLVLDSQLTTILAEEQINKASMVFSLPHSEGSLSKVLIILSCYGINLTKIQSLPVIGKEWEYLFYIDITFSSYKRYRQSLEAFLPLTKEFQLLGEYKSYETE